MRVPGPHVLAIDQAKKGVEYYYPGRTPSYDRREQWNSYDLRERTQHPPTILLIMMVDLLFLPLVEVKALGGTSSSSPTTSTYLGGIA